MDHRTISTDQAPAAVGPYSQGMRVGKFVFSAGQLGIVPGTKEFSGFDIESQTRQALENVKAVLAAAGTCLQCVVKTTVYMADMTEFARMNLVYAEYFPKDPPARSAVQVAALPLSGKIEIEVIAKAGSCKCD